jgi:peroxiredoxin
MVLLALIAASLSIHPDPAPAGTIDPPPARSTADRNASAQATTSIERQIVGLRALPEEKRSAATKQLALQIRRLPASSAKVHLAVGLSHLCTEGDPGHDTLQSVATTLAAALRQKPAYPDPRLPASAYIALARLVHYEGVRASLDAPEFAAALSRLEADDRQAANADFTLTDLDGRSWTLKSLRGKVVLINFWATWCPPCRKELPDLQALYGRFKDQSLVILGITNEKPDVVRPFVTRNALSYPILLDPDGKVGERFNTSGIPCTFIYDREGKLAAQAIDMRTMKQFILMLARAGLR